MVMCDQTYLQKWLTSSINPIPDYFRFGYPLMLKAKKLAYDGKGNAVAKTEHDVEEAFTKLGGTDIYAEKWAPFTKELAVMVVRSASEVGVGVVVVQCSVV